MIVQYFQYARFEWHPELPSGERVLLTNLGYKYFLKIGEDPYYLMATSWMNPDTSIPQTILGLQVRAFPQDAVLPQSGVQTIYIIVQDQNLLPVPGALVILTIKLPSGEEQRIALPGSTDKFGVIKYTFTYSGQPTGVTQVRVTALYDNFQKQSVTSFRIWY
jgi:peptidoglycan hydrolase-like protein with peptidoglycan-binding domain